VQVWQTSNLRQLRLGEEKKVEEEEKEEEEEEKEEEEEEEKTTGQKYNVRICYAGRP